jgi:hypothetical protein
MLLVLSAEAKQLGYAGPVLKDSFTPAPPRKRSSQSSGGGGGFFSAQRKWLSALPARGRGQSGYMKELSAMVPASFVV